MILSDIIQEDLDRIVKKYNPRKETINGGLSEYDVLRVHYIVSDYFLSEGDHVIYGLKSFDLLSSAVSRQEVEFGGFLKWKDDYHKMATLLYGIVKNHAFEDGNKRTALLSLLFYFHKTHLQVRHKKSVLEQLIKCIASNELATYYEYKNYLLKDDPDINFIADKIKKTTGKIDKRIYPITYADFNRRIKKYGLWLGLPKRNHIKVYREKKNFSSLEETIKQKDLLIKIRFTGWMTKINPKTIKKVLRSAELTPENGIDSKVFFKDVDPLYVLIREYKEPLRRLKDE